MPITELSCDGSFPEVLSDNDFPMDVSEPVEEESDNTETERSSKYHVSCLGLLKNELSFHLWSIYLGYNPRVEVSNPTEVSFLSLTRLDAWLSTVCQLLLPNEIRGGARQRDYNQLFQQNHVSAVSQLTSLIFEFVKYWVPDELCIQSVEGKTNREVVLGVTREATCILFSKQDNTYYISVKSNWFATYISPTMGLVHDCFIARISDDWDSITRLAPHDFDLSVTNTVERQQSRGPSTSPRGTDKAPIEIACPSPTHPMGQYSAIGTESTNTDVLVPETIEDDTQPRNRSHIIHNDDEDCAAPSVVSPLPR